jgi:hypothetical protein
LDAGIEVEGVGTVLKREGHNHTQNGEGEDVFQFDSIQTISRAFVYLFLKRIGICRESLSPFFFYVFL